MLISLEEMETIRWIEFLNKNTKIFLTDTRILPAEVKEYPENIKEELKNKFKNFFIINQKDILEKVGKPKFVNTGILGFVSNHLQFSEDEWKRSIKEEVPSGSFDENWEAFLSVRNNTRE
jgi:indolepyruvate ferredoxin oxidoreductase beta subunit